MSPGPRATDIASKVAEIARYQRLFWIRLGRYGDITGGEGDRERSRLRKLLGHCRVWVLVLTLVAAAAVLPARAEASSHTGGAAPHAPRVRLRHHATARLRPDVAAHLRRHATPPRGRHATARLRRHGTPALHPNAVARISRAIGIRGARRRASRAARHRAFRAARHRASIAGRSPRARRVGVNRLATALIIRGYEPLLTSSPAAGLGRVPSSAAGPHPRHRAGSGVTAGRRRAIGPSRARKSVAVASAVAMTPAISPPAPGVLPPGGAEGFASGAGGASAGATASAVLALAGVALLAALLPGLLALDVLPWRSGVFTLRLERPG